HRPQWNATLILLRKRLEAAGINGERKLTIPYRKRGKGIRMIHDYIVPVNKRMTINTFILIRDAATSRKKNNHKDPQPVFQLTHCLFLNLEIVNRLSSIY